MRFSACLVALCLAACGPGTKKDESTADPTPEGEAITRETVSGPVRATVSLRPAKPRLGDALVVTLDVHAEAGVRVQMPAFGEALGRFSITDFTPRSRTLEDGGTRASQRYTLQAPMSGRQRIPPLRVEFIDERPDHASDGGPQTRELLTDEIPVSIASVLQDDDSAKALRGPLGRLAERADPGPLTRHGSWAAGALAIVALLLGLRWWSRRAVERARLSAFDVAMRRLANLEARGLPSAGQADAWYVELSGIVRRYLEDRHGLRAPELTTEEFLREARRADALSASHQDLLGAFLEGCDRVKFAAHEPTADESEQALAAARRFLEETRIEAPATSAPAAASVGAS